MKTKLQILVAVLVTGLVLTAAQRTWALVIDFEDLIDPSLPKAYAPIPNPYQGVSIVGPSGALALTNTYFNMTTGVQNGTIGHVGVLSGTQGLTFSFGAQIDFLGASITAFLMNGQDFKVEGWQNGNLISSKTLLTSMTLNTFTFDDINHVDMIKILPGTQGTVDLTLPQGNAAMENTHWLVVDNVSYIFNPEPTSILLLGSGLAGLGLWRLTKKGSTTGRSS